MTHIQKYCAIKKLAGCRDVTPTFELYNLKKKRPVWARREVSRLQMYCTIKKERKTGLALGVF